jgi:hypothetical protein
MNPELSGMITLPVILAAHKKRRDDNLRSELLASAGSMPPHDGTRLIRDPCALLDSTYPPSQHGLWEDKLCEDCSKVDFNQITTQEMERQDIGMLAMIWRNTLCPFCRIVKAAFREHIDGSAYWYETLCFNGLDHRFFLDSRVSRRRDDNKDDQYAHQIVISCIARTRDSDVSGIVTAVNNRQISFLDVVPDRCTSLLIPRYSRRTVGTYCDMELLRTWQENCLQQHDHSTQVEAFPERLFAESRVRGIDVESLRLTALSPQDHYCSLSYVCGDITQTALGARYRKADDTYVSFDALPQVLKDALWVTRKLGYRFLWYVSANVHAESTPAILDAFLKKGVRHADSSRC